MAERDDYARINDGLSRYARGDAWGAHESWEAVWLKSEDHEKAALQALIQTAAGVHKFQEGSSAGVDKNLQKARASLLRATTAPASGAAETEAQPGAAQRSAIFGIDLVALDDGLRAALTADPASFVPPPLPATTGPDGFIYLHGFASSPRSYKATQIVPALQQRGWSVANPDLNEGDFTGLTVSRSLRRIRRLLRDRTVVIGSSLGGYLAALLQHEDDRIVATVLMAPAFDFVERLRQRHGALALDDWARQGVAEVEHYGAGRMEKIGYGLVEDAQNHPSRPPLRVPTYVLQGLNDDTVPADMVAQVVAAAPADLVTYCPVDDDHALAASVGLARAAAESFGDRFAFTPDPALTS